jgi:hypothetical protein
MKAVFPTIRTVGAPGIAAAALWMLAAAMPAHAEGALHRLMRPADAERLARFEQTRAAALTVAQHHPDTARRAYWRLQASRSPCSTLTDYIDVYF